MVSPEEFYQALPTKRGAAGVIFFNGKKEILIVKPNYRDGWLLPGGAIDDNESPRQAAIREIKEELDLQINNLQLVCVDYKIKHDYKPEGYFFVFYGGKLSNKEIENIKLQDKELTEMKFVDMTEAKGKLMPGIVNRLDEVMVAIKNNRIVYLENGQEV